MTLAIGDIDSRSNAKRSVCLLAAATATSAAPTLVTDGVPCYPTRGKLDADDGLCFTGRAAREAVIVVASSAGSATMSVTLRMWGYLAIAAKWVPIGVGPDTTKGTLNEGNSIGETSADSILHSEAFYLPGHFDRLYLQVVAIGGTSTAINAWLTTALTVGF